MTGKKYNILLLETENNHKNVIKDLLVNNGFNVHISSNGNDAASVVNGLKPDIILCRTGKNKFNKESLINPYHNISLTKKIPFVIIPSGADVEFFLSALGKGLSHSINTPFSSESLISRIKGIIESNITSAGDSPLPLEFTYMGSKYSIEIRPTQLVEFILSILNDSVNYSNSLSRFIHEKKRNSDAEFEKGYFEGADQNSETEKLLEKELYDAVDNKEFILYYQPIIYLPENRLSGFEALIRWNHPSRGLVQPSDFIPLAERLPLIIPLGIWVIEEAVKQILS
jgi:CheY-like chemotaxis protein